MTKYYEEQQRTERIRQQKEDVPIAISGEHTTEHRKKYFCHYCSYSLVKISESEYFCNHCSISAYPDIEQLRSKSKISTPIGMSLEPCLSYAPEPNDLSKKPVEIKGGLKTLKDRGIKITSYKEGFG